MKIKCIFLGIIPIVVIGILSLSLTMVSLCTERLSDKLDLIAANIAERYKLDIGDKQQ